MPIFSLHAPSGAVDTSTAALIERALTCAHTGERLRAPVAHNDSFGWAVEAGSPNRVAAFGALVAPQPREVPHRLLRAWLQAPKLTAAAILNESCPITLEAPLKLPILSASGHTYSGALWQWQLCGGAREPLCGAPVDHDFLQSDHTVELLLDIAASEDFPAHRAALAGCLADLPCDKVDAPNLLGDTPLALAAKYGHTDTLRELLLAPGHALQSISTQGRTALGHAVAHQQASAAMMLVDAGGAFGGVDAQGYTPWGHALHHAVQHAETTGERCMETFYHLLHAPQGRTSIDAPMAIGGMTPMHLAYVLGAQEQVVDLFEVGASCDIPNAQGDTVRQLLAHNPDFTWERGE